VKYILIGENMEPVIEFLQCHQRADRDKIYRAVSALWTLAFGDSEEYIWQFCQDMPLVGAVLAMSEKYVAGMALLLQPDAAQNAYYGYSVCTHPGERGRGICRRIHEKIRAVCEERRAGYFVRPAEHALIELYGKLGLKTLQWEDERIVTTDKVISHTLLSPKAYAQIRQQYFASSDLYAWDAEAIRFMCQQGYTAAGFSLEGTSCAAFLLERERIVCEICAPDTLLDRAAICAASALGGQAMVRLPGNKHMGYSAVMGYGTKENFYFNLYIE
jgi:hypothetical protein